MTDQAQARELAESARQKTWAGASFLRQTFLGTFDLSLLESLDLGEPERPRFWQFYHRLREFLANNVDPQAIDETGEYPDHVVSGLAAIGAFGMKIPREYGGLGLSHPEYMRCMELLGSYDANVTALLSAHQAIGVPQPIKLFGTEEQKQRFLPRCARGSISAFALTEPAVGSDPGQLATRAEPSDDGETFVLNGEKLWCTNGTIAELIVVMARNPENDAINAFVLEMDSPGVTGTHRCRFMGLRALANAFIELRDVRVPRENLIGDEGDGLKIALATLNTGRLSLPAGTAGAAKASTQIVRTWSAAREQWGQPIGKHEAVAHMNAGIVTSAFAMDAVTRVVGALADRDDTDIRLEAAAAKEWNTRCAWQVVDDTLQVRGGRGYETEASLAGRGEAAIGVERAMRDSRINLIFEGSSEIMHLFMAREAVDEHLEVAGTLVDPKAGLGAKLQALPRIALHYAFWYPGRWLGWGHWPRYRRYGVLAKHLRYAERASRKLARQTFHGMAAYRASLEHKQAFLFRVVDIALEIFALAASICRAQHLRRAANENAEPAVELADAFACGARRRIDELFRGLWSNDDKLRYRIGRHLLDGRYTWLEEGTLSPSLASGRLKPETMDEALDREVGDVATEAAPVEARSTPDEAASDETKRNPSEASEPTRRAG